MTSKRQPLDADTLRDWFERSLTDCADFYEHKPHAFLWSARRCAEALCATLATRADQRCDKIDEQSLDALAKHVPKKHQGSVRNIQLVGNYGTHVQPSERFDLRLLHTKSEEIRGSLIVLTEWFYDEELGVPRPARVDRDLARIRAAGAATVSTPPIASANTQPLARGLTMALLVSLGALVGAAIVWVVLETQHGRIGSPARSLVGPVVEAPVTPVEVNVTETDASRQEVRDANIADLPTPSVPDGLVYVPAGEVVIGQPSRSSNGWGAPLRPNETPRAVLDAFALDRHAVTMRDYEARTAHDPQLVVNWALCAVHPAAPEEPVVCVTWAQADRYCRARGGRLPRLAEWEREADATITGMSTAMPEFEWVDDLSPAEVLGRGPPRPCPDESGIEHPRCHHTRKNRLSEGALPRYYWNIFFEERRVHSLGFRCVVPMLAVER